MARLARPPAIALHRPRARASMAHPSGGDDDAYDSAFPSAGRANLLELLTGMNGRIAEAREHALSRKDILEKVEKWTLPTALLENLSAKMKTWLKEKAIPFMYDKVAYMGIVG